MFSAASGPNSVGAHKRDAWGDPIYGAQSVCVVGWDGREPEVSAFQELGRQRGGWEVKKACSLGQYEWIVE